MIVRLPRLRTVAAGVVAGMATLGALVSVTGPALAAGGNPGDSGDTGAPTVVVGVTGLRWTDIDASTTPTMRSLVAAGSVASLPVLAIDDPAACPLNGWLTLSAGRTVPVDDAGGSDQSQPADTVLTCGSMPAVTTAQPTADGPGAATVEGWASLDPEPVDAATAVAPIGTLGDLIGSGGQCATAVGPGAAVMLATTGGQVARYLPDVDALTNADFRACGTTVVDMGALPDAATARATTLRQLDTSLREITAGLPQLAHLILVGIPDSLPATSGLQVVVDWTLPGSTATWLTSESTHRAGLVVLPDVTASVAADAGLDDAARAAASLEGAPLHPADARHISTARTIEERSYLAVRSATNAAVGGPFLATFALIVGCVLAWVALSWHRSRRRGSATLPAWGRQVAGAAMAVCASIPAAACLVRFVRWWATPAPTVALTCVFVVATVLVALAAWGISRWLRPTAWRLAIAIAGLSWFVLTLDTLTGTTLEQGSLMGLSLAQGARSLGFSNVPFAFHTAAALIVAGGLGAPLVQRGRRGGALALVVGLGAATALVDGLTGFGANAADVTELAAGFAVLALLLPLGPRQGGVTGRRVLATTGLVVLGALVGFAAGWLAFGAASLHVGGLAHDLATGGIAGLTRGLLSVGGVLGLIVFALGALLVVSPRRLRMTAVAVAYQRWPGLRVTLAAVGAAATVGAAVSEAGTAIAAMLLVVVATLGAAALAAPGTVAAGTLPAEPGAADTFTADTVTADAVPHDTAPPDTAAPHPVTTPPMSAQARSTVAKSTWARSMPTTVVTLGGGLLVTLLLVGSILTPTPGADTDVVAATGAPIVTKGDTTVVIGTQGLRWQDVDAEATPTLWRLLLDGAAAGGVVHATSGNQGTCEAAGWLGLSSDKPTITGAVADGTFSCAPWTVQPQPDGSAWVSGWIDLAELQAASEYKPRLGLLGQSLATASTCATAVGPGAALALADRDGQVTRYRTLDDTLSPDSDAFTCPITVIDAGAVPYGDPERYPASSLDGPERSAAVHQLDAQVARVLERVPVDATVILVDVGNPAGGRAWLGAGLVVDPRIPTPHYLTSASTHWDGVVRLLDLPLSLIEVAGAQVPAEFAGSPYLEGGSRPAAPAETVDRLSDVTARDHTLRSLSGQFLESATYLGLALFLLAIGLPALGRRWPHIVEPGRRGLRLAFTYLAAVPPAAFLMTAWQWWRFDASGWALASALLVSALAIAGLAALVPARSIWARPAFIGAILFGLLTLDGLLGTPLHRGSLLGPAPTLGGRFYGFGNPTYSVYVVGGLFAAAGLATVLARGRASRLLPALGVAAIGGIAFVIDLWPTFGADVGGGLALVPTFAILALGAGRVRLTWARLAAVGAVGVALVAGIGVLDWLRPADQRSHLGVFVQSVVDGTAWETVARKGYYALRTLSSGQLAWITLVVVLAVAWALWGRRRPRWLADAQQRWPIVRPLLISLLVGGLLGAFLNDYGIRIVSLMLFAAVPLVGMMVTTLPPTLDEDARRELAASARGA